MPSKISTIKRIRVLGDFMMFGIFVCLLIIFLHAYFNGLNNDNYQTIVDINSKNEAHVEFIILLVILLPIFFMTTLWSFLDWKATWRARDQIRFQQYFYEPEAQPHNPRDTVLMKCSGCNGTFGITAMEGELDVECPHCGKTGSINVPPTYKKRGGRKAPPTRDDDFDDSYDYDDEPGRGSPKVKIIKDIRN